MAKIIGNTTATPNPRPDWLQNDENKADYIKNKPEVIVRSEIDNELNLESGNPVQNSTIAQRFNELDESLKEYIDEQNSEQDENLGKLETLVTETMKATEINKNSTDDQYSTAKATYDFVKAETAAMVNSAPETLDTLNELAAALGDDPNFATTVATQIGKKADKGAKGSTIKPIYFDENGAQEIAYTIEKSVPADAKFTDTTYTLIKDATNKKIQLMNGDKLVSEVDDNNTTYTIDGSLSTLSTNPVQNKVISENLNNLWAEVGKNTDSIEEINSKDLFETKHEEGNAIAVSDSAEAPFVGMKLYGKTTQDGTPAPDAPIDLVSVGDSGSFNVGIFGNNLYNGGNLSFTKYKLVELSQPLEVGTYTISCTLTTTDTRYGGAIVTFVEGGENGANVHVSIEKDKRVSKTFTLSSPVKYIRFHSSTSFAESEGYDATYTDIMLNVGNIALPYEEYKGQTLTLTDTLRGIGDIKDEVDFNRGVKIQRFVEVDLGTLTWGKAADGLIETKSTIGVAHAPKSSTELANIICTHYLADVAENTWFNVNDQRISMSTNGLIRIRDNSITDYTTLGEQTSGKYLVYQLATPIEIPLSETELNAYRQLHTNKPNTTILSEADMEVDYIVDSTSAEYIENRLEEVEDKIPTKTSQLTNDSSFIDQTGLNTALEDKLSFDEEVINSTSDVTKIVPEGSGKYAAVNKVGGMTYKSRNLLNVTATTQTINGVTFTVNADKSITVNGTATANVIFDLGNVKNELLRSKLILKGGAWGDFDTIVFYMASYDATSEVGSCTDWNGTGAKVNLEGETGWARIFVKSGYTVNNKTFYPMLYHESLTDTTYEPYYSGLRNAYVSEIKSVGKNLLDISGLTEKLTDGKLLGTSLTISKNGLITANGTATGNGGRTKSNARITLEKGTYKMSIYDTNGKSLSTAMAGVYLTYANNVNTHISNAGVFEVTEKTTFIFGVNVLEGKTYNESFYVMICRAEETNKSYEPYKENTFTIPIGARGEGYGLGINESCYNYVDFERKVYVKNVATVDLSTLSWSLMESYYWQTDSLKGLIKPAKDNYTIPNILAENYNNAIWQWGAQRSCIAVNYSGAVACENSSTTEKPTGYFIYELETPIETDISNYIQDNFIEAAAGGVITAVNEYNYNVPTEYEFFTSENPEKVIVADKIVGDLVGIAEEAQSLTGLESSITELNFLKGAKGNLQTQIDQLDAGASSIIIDSELNASSENPVQNKVINSALANKVDKVDGKGLSTNDYTTTEKNKLAGIASGANAYTHPTTSGYKHIPSGGSSGQGLLWSSSGTAKWGAVGVGKYGDSTDIIILNDTNVNQATGIYSLATGRETTVLGEAGSSFGYGTISKGCGQAAFGKYNTAYTGAYAYNGTTGSIFIVGVGTDDTERANAFRITNAGQCMGSQSFTASGADYAEYYEWLDGNPDNEDRRGHFVTFAEGNKIRIANAEDDYILGVVSVNPAVIGNGYTDNWQGMYLTDEYGERLTEIVEVEEYTDEETGEVIPAHTETRFVINPDYDPNAEYVGRNERKEWSAIGTHGQLVLIDDGTCEINHYCTITENGTATRAESKTEYRVIERINDTHIRIVIK